MLTDKCCLWSIVDADWCSSWKNAKMDTSMVVGMPHACCIVGMVTISIDKGNFAKVDGSAW